MDRRTLIVSGLVTLGASGMAQAQPEQLPPARPRDEGLPPPPSATPSYPTAGPSGASDTGRPPKADGYSTTRSSVRSPISWA